MLEEFASAQDVLGSCWVIRPDDVPELADALGVDVGDFVLALERYDVDTAG